MLTFLYLVLYAFDEGARVYIHLANHDDVMLATARLFGDVIYIYIISAMW